MPDLGGWRWRAGDLLVVMHEENYPGIEGVARCNRRGHPVVLPPVERPPLARGGKPYHDGCFQQDGVGGLKVEERCPVGRAETDWAKEAV